MSGCALGARGARPHDVCCADHDETWVQAAIPAARPQEISDAPRVSPPYDLRPIRRVAHRLSWQQLWRHVVSDRYQPTERTHRVALRRVSALTSMTDRT
jgi:hypothetical protein